jgi:hypothetical protein
MNIVQLHDKVLGFLDQSRSGRIMPQMLDAALNTAHADIVNRKTGLENFSGPLSFYPDENGRIKDSLKHYLEERVIQTQSREINVYTALLNASFPLHHILLGVDVNIGSLQVPVWITPSPVNRKDSEETKQNTFSKPRNTAWVTSYLSYSGIMLDLMLPQGVNIAEVRLTYIRCLDLFDFGVMVNHTDLDTDNINVIVSSSKALYDGNIKFRGEVVNIVNHLLLTEGEVYKGYAIVDIDPQIVPLVAASAAQIIAGLKMGILNSNKEG